MSSVKDVELTTLGESQYVIPFRMLFTENGIKRKWDLIKVHPSVAIILYNVDIEKLICVQQFRPGVYINSIPPDERIGRIDIEKYPRDLGVTLEWCAGIVDKNKSLEEIAREEVLEECGYDVPMKDLLKIQSFRCGVGVSGDVMNLYYAEVTNKMKVNEGGGLKEEGECIEVIELDLNRAKQLLQSPSVQSPGEFLFGLMWFFSYKKIPFH